ncbi:hypothetical protein E2C01_094469 [Portunus trituberculatus]|uniref:Uncharacterized protein n=1 Tax=Portunus trituberculatus TaxID=210409 RepID=A0A5B7K3B2_PORTR|nr:hypothetical protein [Portunus trituberculatus]
MRGVEAGGRDGGGRARDVLRGRSVGEEEEMCGRRGRGVREEEEEEEEVFERRKRCVGEEEEVCGRGGRGVEAKRKRCSRRG